MIPDEIKSAVSALSHNTRWNIIEVLQQSDMSYTELLKTVDIQKGSLTHHLNKLMYAGLVDNYSQGKFSGPYNSYYRLSAFGKDFLEFLLSSVEVAIPIAARETFREKDDGYYKTVYKPEGYTERSIAIQAFGLPEFIAVRANKRVRMYENKAEPKYS